MELISSKEERFNARRSELSQAMLDRLNAYFESAHLISIEEEEERIDIIFDSLVDNKIVKYRVTFLNKEIEY